MTTNDKEAREAFNNAAIEWAAACAMQVPVEKCTELLDRVWQAARRTQQGGGVPTEAITALAAYQQADMEGIMVTVSRQAIDEVLDYLRGYAKPSDTAAEVVKQLREALLDAQAEIGEHEGVGHKCFIFDDGSKEVMGIIESKIALADDYLAKAGA